MRFVVAILLLFSMPALAAPKVAVSIKPLHSLVAGVMAGVGEPELIVKGSASPHGFQLKPSQMRALREAELLVFVSPAFERFLPLASLPPEKRLAMAEIPGMTLLPMRGHDEHDGHDHGAHDPHMWLDVANARLLARVLATRLSEIDPENAARYAANAKAVGAKLTALDAALKAALTPLKGKPYFVFHDAYRYFERAYGLQSLDALTLSPDSAPRPKRLAGVRGRIAEGTCVFREPNFPEEKLRAFLQGTPAQTGTLDPEGLSMEEGADMYFMLMRRLAESLSDCLK